MRDGVPVRSVGAGRPPVVALEGSATFRDLGGYPTADGGRTRHRLVFRSAAIADATAADQARIRGVGLRAIVDLRSAFEVEATGPTVFSDLGVPRRHVPVIDASDAASYARTLSQHLGRDSGYGDLGDVYATMLDVGGEAFATAFGVVAEHLPALHLCSAGKDRTGLLSALLLRVARVADPIIAVDYACSVPSGDSGPIEKALAHLDRRWGGAETYLAAHGASRAQMEQFRRTFVSADDRSRSVPVIVLPDDPAELATG